MRVKKCNNLKILRRLKKSNYNRHISKFRTPQTPNSFLKLMQCEAMICRIKKITQGLFWIYNGEDIELLNKYGSYTFEHCNNRANDN